MNIISYNIQAAINSHSYLSYTYQWHRQFLPSPAKNNTLEKIAALISSYDVACLQEVELGGLRNGFRSQCEQLLNLTSFTEDFVQVNRKLSRLSWHGNLILSRFPLKKIVDLPLPGKIKGRGFLAAEIVMDGHSLLLVNTHLSLGQTDQKMQIEYVLSHIKNYPNILICGDFNAVNRSPACQYLIEQGFQHLGSNQFTFPSWQPKKSIDHAFLKGDLKGGAATGNQKLSDHLPLTIEIST